MSRLVEIPKHVPEDDWILKVDSLTRYTGDDDETHEFCSAWDQHSQLPMKRPSRCYDYGWTFSSESRLICTSPIPMAPTQPENHPKGHISCWINVTYEPFFSKKPQLVFQTAYLDLCFFEMLYPNVNVVFFDRLVQWLNAWYQVSWLDVRSSQRLYFVWKKALDFKVFTLANHDDAQNIYSTLQIMLLGFCAGRPCSSMGKPQAARKTAGCGGEKESSPTTPMPEWPGFCPLFEHFMLVKFHNLADTYLRQTPVNSALQLWITNLKRHT